MVKVRRRVGLGVASRREDIAFLKKTRRHITPNTFWISPLDLPCGLGIGFGVNSSLSPFAFPP